jgi:hypothetical protein
VLGGSGFGGRERAISSSTELTDRVSARQIKHVKGGAVPEGSHALLAVSSLLIAVFLFAVFLLAGGVGPVRGHRADEDTGRASEK